MTFDGEPVLDLLVAALEVRVLLVHQADHEQHRVARRHRRGEHLFGADFDAGSRGHQAEGAVRGSESGDRVALEVEVSGGVDQVDLHTLPLRERARNVDGVTALDLFGCVVGEGGAVLDGAVTLTGGGHEGQRVDECRLAAGPVSDYSHISDVSRLVLLHNNDPPLKSMMTSFLGSLFPRPGGRQVERSAPQGEHG